MPDETKQDDGTPRGIVRKWLNELSIADKGESAWRKEAKGYYDLYEAETERANSYNILWSNTEVLRPALYNSTPTPDVRRRFRDEDVVGKACSQVLQRALAYSLDCGDIDGVMKRVVLDALITGRGVSRVKYEPVFVQMTPAMPAGDALPPDPSMAPPEPLEQVADEQAKPQYVYWEDYRHGPGKQRSEVPWEAFRHTFDREELVKMFGPDIGSKVALDDVDNDSKGSDKDVNEANRTAEVWEIWDKNTRTALFINKQFTDGPLLQAPDPLQLEGFFSSADPLYAIESTQSLKPIPPYRLYKQQARELNQVTARINKITAALKVRGAYASNISEMASIFSGDDNSMTPIVNVTEIAAAGGLDKAIWIMPIEKLIVVLNGLYLAREQIKQVIAELTGLSDIVRGSTDPNETKGAQVLKSQWGTLRLQRLQREVQRFARDLTRLIAEIIAQTFSPEQLQAITQVKLPTVEDKMQAQAQMQMAAAAPQQLDPAGQPMPAQVPPPEAQAMLQQPTWDDVMAVLRSDQMRGYKIDIETDSTVAETIDRDMQGLSEAMGALGEFINVVGPLVQSGILPITAAKEGALVIVRRARMGTAFEDAISQIGSDQAMAQQQGQQADQANQILQAINQLGQGMQKQGQDLGSGVQNGLQQLSVQLENAVQNVGKQQMRPAA